MQVKGLKQNLAHIQGSQKLGVFFIINFTMESGKADSNKLFAHETI